MNVTGDIQCDICKTSYGFSSADRRAIIVMVVLAAIALLSCYVGVLWFAIRTRFKSSKNSNVIDNTANKNEAFNNDVENYDEFVQPIENIRNSLPQPITTTQHVHFATEKELY
ncbi:unnamed protein product [Rotaria sp. Silwood2]|nr:unnamed protein product [Rotaria sp. Silwood2]CAF2751053.1 unnamed protein product [Rotaria sp. Silwood2]CAF4280266.1 unnamed protein product [Rotaria sp. Silwood2]CAF4372647.1 unnamed protein product [Rotaria sp. Silwood2]